MKYAIFYQDNSNALKKIAAYLNEKLWDSKVFSLEKNLDEIVAENYIVLIHTNTAVVPAVSLLLIEESICNNIYVCCTNCFDISDDYRRVLSKQIEPFVPDKTEFNGVFLCYEELPQEILNQVEAVSEYDPDNPNISTLKSKYKDAYGHPDNSDLENILRFIL